MHPSVWRLIQSTPAGGAWNMAVDEAILLEIGAGRSLPTLRLYSWEPACLSFGYAQKVKDVDLDALSKKGWTLVRRPTGGRAILHADELTYSVIASSDEPRVVGSVLESYRRLSKALLRSLELIGLNAQADPRAESSLNGSGPVCFEVPSNYEITVGGKKLIGSAQARRGEGVLQHGSLPLFGDLTRITGVLHYEDERSRSLVSSRLLEHATTIETILNKKITIDQVAAAFEMGFQDALGIKFIHGNLSPGEFCLAEELVQNKYASNIWTERI
ncbi:MAG TPA: biotin/lipoate A/B protein ligase family protein [Leptolinea sp.]